MAMGAACGFAAAIGFDSTAAGIATGILAGAGMAAIFAFAVLGLAANQVGSGLALTILGLGLSGLIGAPLRRRAARSDPHVHIPGLADLPGIGRLFFGQDAFVYVALALAAAVALVLNRSRAGLTLRAVGENHVSAHALGLPVLRTRFLAILFGGACAGLAGVYLSLVYTRFWSPGMTAGRGGSRLRSSSSRRGARPMRSPAPISSAQRPCSSCTPRPARSGCRRSFSPPCPIWRRSSPSSRSRSAAAGPAGAPGSLGAPFVPDR